MYLVCVVYAKWSIFQGKEGLLLIINCEGNGPTINGA